MPKVKLIGAVRRVAGEFHEFGAIVDLPAAEADRLVDAGVAEKVGGRQAAAKKDDDSGAEGGE